MFAPYIFRKQEKNSLAQKGKRAAMKTIKKQIYIIINNNKNNENSKDFF